MKISWKTCRSLIFCVCIFQVKILFSIKFGGIIFDKKIPPTNSVLPTKSFILDFKGLQYIIEDMISSTGLYTENSTLFEVIICLNFRFRVYWSGYIFFTFSFILSCWDNFVGFFLSVFHVIRIFNKLIIMLFYIMTFRSNVWSTLK